MTAPLDAADIARALLDEPYPHDRISFDGVDGTRRVRLGGTRKNRCDLCLAVALQAYGDARAAAEREACANVAQEQAHALASGAVRESLRDDPIDIAVALSNEAAIAHRIERLIRARTP